MTKQQASAIEQIKKYVLKNDCCNNSPDYEIKRFEVKETEFGTVWVSSVAGGVNGGGTVERHIAIGKRGGVKACRPDDGKILAGWKAVMLHGH